MSKEKRSPSWEVRRMLDERGVEHYDNDMNRAVRYTRWDNGGKREVRYEEWSNGTTRLDAGNVTPEQAIAATVGNIGIINTEEVLRQLVARLGDAAGLRFASKYVDCIVDEYAGKFATAGNRSCASCPEADNPDSYIVHLQSALKWHDEHVPRPTNQSATCVVLQGEKPPEEVLFVRGEGGVTHYLPEETCHMRFAYEEEDADGCIWPDHYECDACGAKVNGIMPFCDTEIPPKFCPNCRARVVSE